MDADVHRTGFGHTGHDEDSGTHDGSSREQRYTGWGRSRGTQSQKGRGTQVPIGANVHKGVVDRDTKDIVSVGVHLAGCGQMYTGRGKGPG